MKVNAADGAGDLVEADVVETLEAGTGNGPDAVIGHEEILLPAHEDVLALREVLVVEVGLLRLLGQRPPRGELCPVLHVGFLGRAPGFVLGLEGVLRADDFAFEVCGESGVFVGQACGRGRMS